MQIYPFLQTDMVVSEFLAFSLHNKCVLLCPFKPMLSLCWHQIQQSAQTPHTTRPPLWFPVLPRWKDQHCSFSVTLIASRFPWAVCMHVFFPDKKKERELSLLHNSGNPEWRRFFSFPQKQQGWYFDIWAASWLLIAFRCITMTSW